MNAEKLRASILQFAIKGKIVPQLPNEQTPDVEGISIDKEVPFSIPDKWKWVHLDTVCDYIQRGKTPKYSNIQKYPVVAQKCNQWDGFHMEKAKFIEPDSLASYANERFLQDMDVLLNSTGIGTLGKVAIYESNLNPYELAVADGHVTVIRTNKKNLNPKFLYYYLRSPAVQNYIESRAGGSTKQKELNLKTVKQYEIPLPPLLEQNRIVSKVESLLPLIDSYEKSFKKIQTLNKNLPAKLRTSILKEAIQGKLTHQLDSDTPAIQIYNEPDEFPYTIPKNWRWVPLGDCFTLKAGKFIPAEEISKTKNDSHKYPCYGGNGIRGYVKTKSKTGRFPIIGRQGSLCGNINIADGEFYATEHAVVVDCGDNGVCDCVAFFLEAMNLNQYATSTAQPGLSVKKINKLLFPLPPIEEQKRIAEKIKALLLAIKPLTGNN